MRRIGRIHGIQKLLGIWFDNQIQNNILLRLLIIQAKARSIFGSLKARECEKPTESFTEIYGSFQRFRRRFDLYNWRISDEVASADVEAAEKFK